MKKKNKNNNNSTHDKRIIIINSLIREKLIHPSKDPITLFVHQILLSNFNDASYRNQEPVKGVAIAASK